MSTHHQIKVQGKELSCHHCGEKSFVTHNAVQLNTPGMTLFGLDWLNETATVFVCESCGYVHWFLDVNKNK